MNKFYFIISRTQTSDDRILAIYPQDKEAEAWKFYENGKGYYDILTCDWDFGRIPDTMKQYRRNNAIR